MNLQAKLLILLLISLASLILSSEHLISKPFSLKVDKRVIAQVPNSSHEARQLSTSSIKTYSLQLLEISKQQFIGNIKASSNMTNFKVAFDTTQSISYLPKKNCQSCNKGKFDSWTINNDPFVCAPSNSCESFGSFSIYFLSNGGYSAKGSIVKTPIGLEGLSPIDQYIFHIDQFPDGRALSQYPVIGLGIKNHKGFGGSTFVEDLHKEGRISDPIFSFYLSPTGGLQNSNSELIFGGFNTSKVPDVSKITYHDAFQSMKYDRQVDYWGIPSSLISIGDNQLQLDSGTAFIDSTQKHIQVPEILFTKIMRRFQLEYSANYDDGDQTFTVDCNANLPDISVDLFLKNGHKTTATYSIPKEYYTGSNHDNLCDIFISPISKKLYPPVIKIVLGTSFLIGQVSIFNYSNKTIGFAIPVEDNNNKSQFPWVLTGILIGLGIVAIVGIFEYLHWKNKKKLQMHEDQLLYCAFEKRKQQI